MFWTFFLLLPVFHYIPWKTVSLISRMDMMHVDFFLWFLTSVMTWNIRVLQFTKSEKRITISSKDVLQDRFPYKYHFPSRHALDRPHWVTFHISILFSVNNFVLKIISIKTALRPTHIPPQLSSSHPHKPTLPRYKQTWQETWSSHYRWLERIHVKERPTEVRLIPLNI